LIRSILTLTRDELEKRFFVREPFAVLTIRKPGSKFVRIPHKDLCVGECKLMFHDAESSPEMGRMRLLMPASQATKLVRFVKQVQDQCALLVCQCESGDSLASSVAQPLSKWLDIPIVTGDEQHGCNDFVKTMVETAIEVHETTPPIENTLIEHGDQRIPAVTVAATFAAFDRLVFPGSDTCRPLSDCNIVELGRMAFGTDVLTEDSLYILNVLHFYSSRRNAQVCFASNFGRCLVSAPEFEALNVLAVGLTANQVRILCNEIRKSTQNIANLLLVLIGGEVYEFAGPLLSHEMLTQHSFHEETRTHLTTFEHGDGLSAEPMHIQINQLPGWQKTV